MTEHASPLNRRTALRTVAGTALAALAGCLNDSSSSNQSSQDSLASGGPLQRIAVEGTSLVVEIASDAALDRVSLIQPNGEQFGHQEIVAEVEQVSFELGIAYDPGEYEILAFNGEETVVESSVSLQPNVRIIEMGIGSNQPEEMWDGPEDEISEEAFVTVENQGTGPDTVTKLLFLGDVPYPSDEDGTNYVDNDDVSGIYDPESDSEVERDIIPPGEQVTIYSSRSPFAFVPGAGTSCSDVSKEGQFELILETGVNGNEITKTYLIQYSSTQGSESCDISISEA